MTEGNEGYREERVERWGKGGDEGGTGKRGGDERSGSKEERTERMDILERGRREKRTEQE